MRLREKRLVVVIRGRGSFFWLAEKGEALVFARFRESLMENGVWEVKTLARG